MKAKTAKSKNLAPIGYDPKDLFDKNDVVLRDKDFERSLVNIVDPRVAAAIQAIPDRLFTLSETALRREVNPDELCCRLRLQFWDEYQAAQDEQRSMTMAAVMKGVTYAEYFYKQVLPFPEKLIWIVTPPTDYLVAIRDLLFVGIERLRELLRTPIVRRVYVRDKKGNLVLDKKGRPFMEDFVDVKLAAEVRQIVEKLSDRVHGAVVQRMHSKHDVQTASLHVHAAADPLNSLPHKQLLDLDQQLASISKELEAVAPKPVAQQVDEEMEALLATPDPG